MEPVSYSWVGTGVGGLVAKIFSEKLHPVIQGTIKPSVHNSCKGYNYTQTVAFIDHYFICYNFNSTGGTKNNRSSPNTQFYNAAKF